MIECKTYVINSFRATKTKNNFTSMDMIDGLIVDIFVQIIQFTDGFLNGLHDTFFQFWPHDKKRRRQLHFIFIVIINVFVVVFISIIFGMSVVGSAVSAASRVGGGYGIRTHFCGQSVHNDVRARRLWQRKT